MFSQVVGRLVLACVLLAGWQAALEHPIGHVDERGAFVHLYDGHSHQGESGATECDALAALGACAPGAVQRLAMHERAETTIAVRSAPAPRSAGAPPFFSQGPPARA